MKITHRVKGLYTKYCNKSFRKGSGYTDASYKIERAVCLGGLRNVDKFGNHHIVYFNRIFVYNPGEDRVIGLYRAMEEDYYHVSEEAKEAFDKSRLSSKVEA